MTGHSGFNAAKTSRAAANARAAAGKAARAVSKEKGPIDDLISDVCALRLTYCEDDKRDLEVRAVSMSQTGDDLLLGLTINYERDPKSRWEVRASGVRNGKLRLFSIAMPVVCDDYPFLSPYDESLANLVLHKAPADRSAFIREFREAHGAATHWWYPARRFLETECGVFDRAVPPGTDLVAAGTALFAEGPLTLIKAYAEVARKHGAEPTIEDVEPSDEPPLLAFVLCNAWIVAESFSCKRIGR